jgi:hypothetical protein
MQCGISSADPGPKRLVLPNMEMLTSVQAENRGKIRNFSCRAPVRRANKKIFLPNFLLSARCAAAM